MVHEIRGVYNGCRRGAIKKGRECIFLGGDENSCSRKLNHARTNGIYPDQYSSPSGLGKSGAGGEIWYSSMFEAQR